MIIGIGIGIPYPETPVLTAAVPVPPVTGNPIGLLLALTYA